MEWEKSNCYDLFAAQVWVPQPAVPTPLLFVVFFKDGVNSIADEKLTFADVEKMLVRALKADTQATETRNAVKSLLKQCKAWKLRNLRAKHTRFPINFKFEQITFKKS